MDERSGSDPKEGMEKDGVYVSIEAIETLRGLFDQAEGHLRSARRLLAEQFYQQRMHQLDYQRPEVGESDQRVIEGVFDGERMLGPDGRHYPVPPNYASKSKLVAGDILKLTIGEDGTFIYKQIGPVERQKLIATLGEDNGRFFAQAEDKQYQLLTASVTYYRARAGDQVTIIVPRHMEADWAAIENILDQASVA